MNKHNDILMYLRIKKLGFTPNEYFYLRLVQAEKLGLSDMDEAEVQASLAQKGELEDLIKLLDNNVNIDHLVESYRNIFPKMILPSGKSARSTSLEVSQKMKWFLANHEFSADDILQATQIYVDEKAASGYEYMQTASYFIYKEDRNKVKSSSLAERCEMLGEEPQNFGIDV